MDQGFPWHDAVYVGPVEQWLSRICIIFLTLSVKNNLSSTMNKTSLWVFN